MKLKHFLDEANSKKPIRIFKNKEYGIEAHVYAVWGKENMEGYGVKLKDTDAKMFLDITKIFPNEKDANDYAKHLTKKY